MVNSSQILKFLRSNKERYRKEYHLIRVGIFGSIARGEETSTSDIDLIIEFEEGTPSIYEIKQKLKLEIQNQFAIPVDICREKYIKPFFKKQIMLDTKYA